MFGLKYRFSPVSQTQGEIRGFLDRADYMLSIAESSLADVSLTDTDKPGFKRYIKRTPLGVVLVIAPWKYVQSCILFVKFSAYWPITASLTLFPSTPYSQLL